MIRIIINHLSTYISMAPSMKKSKLMTHRGICHFNLQFVMKCHRHTIFLSFCQVFRARDVIVSVFGQIITAMMPYPACNVVNLLEDDVGRVCGQVVSRSDV